MKTGLCDMWNKPKVINDINNRTVMKNSLSLGLILSGLLLLNVAAFAQDPDLTAEEVLKNTVAASSNMHGCDFPRLDKENRAYFRLYSPDVKRLQVDICGKNMK